MFEDPISLFLIFFYNSTGHSHFLLSLMSPVSSSSLQFQCSTSIINITKFNPAKLKLRFADPVSLGLELTNYYQCTAIQDTTPLILGFVMLALDSIDSEQNYCLSWLLNSANMIQNLIKYAFD